MATKEQKFIQELFKEKEEAFNSLFYDKKAHGPNGILNCELEYEYLSNEEFEIILSFGMHSGVNATIVRPIRDHY